MQLTNLMGCPDLAHGAGQAAHHQAVGASAFAEVFDTLEQFAIGDARSRKEDILG